MKKAIALITLLAVCLTLTAATAREWTERQQIAHQIANLARGMGLPEDDPIIVRASELWWEDAQNDDVLMIEEPEEEVYRSKEAEIFTVASPDLFSGVLPYEIAYDPETEYLAVGFAKQMYGAWRGGVSEMEFAAHVQAVYERYYLGGLGTGTDLWSILTSPGQFEYRQGFPTVSDCGYDLTALARDVIYRNKLLQQGYTREQAGIVLGEGYCWYVGRHGHNWFYNDFGPYGACGGIWNWSLPNPYGS